MRWRARIRRLGARGGSLIGLLVAFTVVTGLLLGQGFDAEVKSRAEADKAAGAYERSAHIEALRNCRHLTGGEKAYCDDRAFRRARDKQRQEYQLEADRKAAIWAAAAGQAAAFALLLSVMTILAVLLTYLQQQREARIAILGLWDARRRARDALVHAQITTDLELRPYVFVDQIVSLQTSERMFRITVCLKNFGKTPARNMEAIVTVYVTRDLSKLKPLRPKADRIQLGTAGPSGVRRAMRPLIFSTDQWEAPPFDRALGVVRVKYTYTDDTGRNSFEESFDYFTDPTVLTGEDEPKFFLLNEQRIKEEKRRQAQQGDFLRMMRREWKRRRTRAKRDSSEDDEPEQGSEPPDE